jgi:hypothetical protein
MLDPETWSPARRLVALQKGADETEPFACRLFSRVDKGGQQAETAGTLCEEYRAKESATEGADSLPGGEERSDLTMDELKQINRQLYQFAVKNVLNIK